LGLVVGLLSLEVFVPLLCISVLCITASGKHSLLAVFLVGAGLHGSDLFVSEVSQA